MEGENELSTTSSASEACLGATSMEQRVNRGINRMILNQAEQRTLFQEYAFVWIKFQANARVEQNTPGNPRPTTLRPLRMSGVGMMEGKE